jgi:hypothetical protein
LVPELVREAVAQAFVHSLTVEARDKILPKFEIRRGLVIGDTSEHDTYGALGVALYEHPDRRE